MTKKNVKQVIKGYRYINDAIESGFPRAEFYKGKRKKVFNITEEIKTVCEIIALIYDEESDENIRTMIKNILDGQSDYHTMRSVCYSKTPYYARKRAFLQKVYDCCISKNLVSFEEILKEKIA